MFNNEKKIIKVKFANILSREIKSLYCIVDRSYTIKKIINKLHKRNEITQPISQTSKY